MRTYIVQMRSHFLINLFLVAGLLMAASVRAEHGHEGNGHPSSGGADTPHLMVGVMDHEPPLNAPMRGIIRDAYVEIGRVPHFVSSPPRRSLMLAGNGLLDAEMFRVAAVEELYPDLIRVNVPLYQIQGIVYGKNPDLPIFACQDLRDYRVGVVRGVVIMENCAEGAQAVVQAPSTAQLAKLLDQDRIDLILVERAMGELQIAPLVGRDVVALKAPLLSAPIYHYLHRKNAALKEPLERALRRLHAGGDIEFRLAHWRIQQFPAGVGPEKHNAFISTPESPFPSR